MENTMEEINDFIVACDNMTNSKFIFANKRIGDVLKAIATVKPVYNAIAESMINFNFAGSYKIATSKLGEFIIPEDRLVAFVFCLLKAIDDGKININELLVKHFPSDDDKHSSYALFCQKTVIAFKNQIVSKLGGVTPKKVVEKTKLVQKKDNSIKERLEFLVKDVKTYVAGSKKIKGSKLSKQKYLDIIDMLLLAISKEDEDYYSFFVALLEDNSGKDKELKNRLNSIVEIVENKE